MNTTEHIIGIAKDCAKTRNLSLNTTKGEKSFFEKYLRKEIREHLKQDHSEKVLSNKCSYRVDYFIKEEATVIELELSSNRSNTNFERDSFKVIIAKEEGVDIKHFIMLRVYGTEKRHNEPGPDAIKEIMKDKFGIEVQVIDIAQS